MKKIIGVLLLFWLMTSAASAQKFGYIDSEFILSKMPAYAAAQQEVNNYSSNWQKDIENLNKEAEQLNKKFQAEEVLLTDAMKAKRRAEIVAKEKEAKDFQKKVFGFEGMLFKKRQELIKPVQDNLFEAVEKVSKKKGLQVMFDKSGDMVMIYTNPVHDYTEYVLEELGLASPEQNTPGKRPANALIDKPGDTPTRPAEEEAGEVESLKEQPRQPARQPSRNAVTPKTKK